VRATCRAAAAPAHASGGGAYTFDVGATQVAGLEPGRAFIPSVPGIWALPAPGRHTLDTRSAWWIWVEASRHQALARSWAFGSRSGSNTFPAVTRSGTSATGCIRQLGDFAGRGSGACPPRNLRTLGPADRVAAGQAILGQRLLVGASVCRSAAAERAAAGQPAAAPASLICSMRLLLPGKRLIARAPLYGATGWPWPRSPRVWAPKRARCRP